MGVDEFVSLLQVDEIMVTETEQRAKWKELKMNKQKKMV